MPAGTKVAKAEQALKASAHKRGLKGRRADEGKLKREYGDNKGAIYGTLNKIGLMRGNKPTKRGLKTALD